MHSALMVIAVPELMTKKMVLILQLSNSPTSPNIPTLPAYRIYISQVILFLNLVDATRTFENVISN